VEERRIGAGGAGGSRIGLGLGLVEGGEIKTVMDVLKYKTKQNS
jgi:hypothetical protein